MEYLAFSVVCGALFGMFLYGEEKRNRLKVELDTLWNDLTRTREQISRMDSGLDAIIKNQANCSTAVASLQSEMKEITEAEKARDKQEARFYDGLNGILNYTVEDARKAAGQYGEE